MITKFRANEEILRGNIRASELLVGRHIEPQDRARCQEMLDGLIAQYGPVVESYPCWHPLVANYKSALRRADITTRPDDCGFVDLDHTIFLKDALITCPYSDGVRLTQSVLKVSEDLGEYLDGIAHLDIEERDDVKLYHSNATTFVIKCLWDTNLAADDTVPARVAVPLMLEKLLPFWRNAQHAEPWSAMAPFILGRPYGGRSSLFVNQETGQEMKNVFNTLNKLGVFGPVA